MNRKTETAGFPYADRPMWLYSRSSDKRMFVLIQQMRNLLEEANHREYTVVGTSQDMGYRQKHGPHGPEADDAECAGRLRPRCACAGFIPPEPRFPPS